MARLGVVLVALMGVVMNLSQVAALTLSNSANPEDFAKEMGVQVDSSNQHSVLQRPTVGVMIVVDGEGPLFEEEYTPVLKTLQKVDSPAQSWRDIFSAQGLDKARYIAKDGFAFATSNAEEDGDAVEVYWKLEAQEMKTTVKELLRDPRQHTGKHLVVVEDEAVRLDAELALVGKLVETAVANKEARPTLIYASVFGLKNRNSNERSNSFGTLSRELESIYRTLSKGTARPLFTVVFTEKKQGPTPQITTETQLAESRRLQSSTKRTPFQGSDYVIMFWVLVALMFLSFFVICCIPWAPVLDPALRSTLKQDSKRD